MNRKLKRVARNRRESLESHDGPVDRETQRTPEELLKLFLGLPLEKRQELFRTPKEVAFRLGKENPSIVRKWIDEGLIAYTKVAGSLYVYVPSLNEWLLRRLQNRC